MKFFRGVYDVLAFVWYLATPPISKRQGNATINIDWVLPSDLWPRKVKPERINITLKYSKSNDDLLSGYSSRV